VISTAREQESAREARGSLSNAAHRLTARIQQPASRAVSRRRACRLGPTRTVSAAGAAPRGASQRPAQVRLGRGQGSGHGGPGPHLPTRGMGSAHRRRYCEKITSAAIIGRPSCAAGRRRVTGPSPGVCVCVCVRAHAQRRAATGAHAGTQGTLLFGPALARLAPLSASCVTPAPGGGLVKKTCVPRRLGRTRPPGSCAAGRAGRRAPHLNAVGDAAEARLVQRQAHDGDVDGHCRARTALRSSAAQGTCGPRQPGSAVLA